MIAIYFGLPGSGKTTAFTMLALKACRAKSPYAHVYGNVHLTVPGYCYITNDMIGKYDLSNSLILIDEASLFADNRNYKSFGQDKLSFFLQYRHYHCDIVLFAQKWDAVDIKIRTICDRVYWIYKPFLTGFCQSKIIRIPNGIDFVSKKQTGQKYGDIIEGYGSPSLLSRLFASRIFRPRYYKYFDSWTCPPLPPLPYHWLEINYNPTRKEIKESVRHNPDDNQSYMDSGIDE